MTKVQSAERRLLPIYWLTLAIAVVSAIGVLATLNVPALVPGAPPWWLMAAAFFAAEASGAHVEFRRESMTLCLTEIPLVLGLVFVGPALLVAERLLGTFLLLGLIEKQRPVKLLFNLARSAAETLIAVAVFRVLIGGSDPHAIRAWAAVAVAMLVSDQFSDFIVKRAIRIAEGGGVEDASVMRVISRMAVLVNSALGLLLVFAVTTRPSIAALVSLVAFGVFWGMRGYALLNDRSRTLEHLFEFTSEIGPAVDLSSIASVILRRTENLLRADRAQIVIFPDKVNVTAVRVNMDSKGNVTTSPAPEIDIDSEPWRSVFEGKALRLPADMPASGAYRVLADLEAAEALLNPLATTTGVMGALIAVDRSGQGSSFLEDEARLLETIAQHAAGAIEKGRLVDLLRSELDEKRHRSLHDGLTGLPNRIYFEERVSERLAEAGPNGHVSVMLMDLNRFKDVNDTLGHGVGDHLLQAIANRLANNSRGTDLVARLGGDEFGILVSSIASEDEAVSIAQRIIALFDLPFEFDGRSFSIGASLGIAMNPEHGDSPEILLQRADVAMYVAKVAGQGWSVYNAEFDRNSPQRLLLGGDLARAIEFDELVVHYQAILDVDSQTLVGAEALVRWQHPIRGLIGPDAFIDLAEERNLAGPLARFVLRRALMECADWRANGRMIGVAVNCSVSNLLDSSFADDISTLLSICDVPATALTIEVTESMQVLENPRAVETLERIHNLGVKVAVDDFGTGYSSLAYLRRLPIDQVKIDRSFVQQMLTHTDDAAIVGAIVELCRSLGMRVVAEGVETEEVWSALRSMGCDRAQGYWVSRPVSATAFVELSERMPVSILLD